MVFITPSYRQCQCSLPSPGQSPWSSPRWTPRSPSLSRTMSLAPYIWIYTYTHPYIIYIKYILYDYMMICAHLVKFHKFPNTVEHVVILGSSAGHLLYYGGHVTKDCGVEQGWNMLYNMYFIYLELGWNDISLHKNSSTKQGWVMFYCNNDLLYSVIHKYFI